MLEFDQQSSHILWPGFLSQPIQTQAQTCFNFRLAEMPLPCEVQSTIAQPLWRVYMMLSGEKMDSREVRSLLKVIK